MKKIFLLRWVGGLTIALACSACAPAFTQPDPTDMLEFATQGTLSTGDFDLGYVESGTPGRPLIVFIHGTPGSWHGFEHFLRDERLQNCCHMIAVDRLGFGTSAASGSQPEFAVQSAAIAATFALNQSHQLVLAGHSLGGSIAADLAVRYPDAVDALLIMSSSLDPALSAPRWYHRLADWPGVRNVIPPDLRLANEEMLILQESLQMVARGFANLKVPVRFIQGDKDPLVNPENVTFAESQLAAPQLEVHRFPDDGHFIIWERPEFVIEQLLELVAATEP